MVLELRVSGPGLDLQRPLAAGEPVLVLGRDADCAVCLPDPDRNVSRRHLSVWNEGGQLHFQVLSVVNGVETRAGTVPPGARGVLAPGDTMVLAAYRLSVAAIAPDPWADFEREAAQLLPEAAAQAAPVQAEADDPFGDWGFQSTFGPGVPGGSLSAQALQAATDLAPFLRGLGREGPGPRGLTEGELETLGRVARIAVQSLLRAVPPATAPAGRQGGSLTEPRERNPLRLAGTEEAKLDYLFGGLAAAAGFLPQDRALAQLAGELAARDDAMAEALRLALEAFARDFAERYPQGDEWARALLERHFGPASIASLLRAKRNTGPVDDAA